MPDPHQEIQPVAPPVPVLDTGINGAPPATSYAPRSIRRARRTKASMSEIEQAIYDVLADDHPMTVRQTFYALTVRGVIEKTEAEYKGTVVRLLTRLRRDGTVPYTWVSDNTRWMRKPETYSGIAHCLRQTAQLYRRDLWANADTYVEVWCEKDALAGVLIEETELYDVPLMVSRGFSSDTFLQSSASAIIDAGKPAFVYHFGDHDPSGLCIDRQIQDGFARHAPGTEIHFERIAVTPDQIAGWRLPTRPTKREGNTHAIRFEGNSVELDAIPAASLRTLVRACIERHVDHRKLNILKEAEASERGLLLELARLHGGRTVE